MAALSRTLPLRYLGFSAAWTAGFTALFLAMGVTGPGGQGYGAMARLPALLAFALALGSFPAGISISEAVLKGHGRGDAPGDTPGQDSGPKPLFVRLLSQGGMTLLASILMYVVVGYLAPSALASERSGETASMEVAHLTSAQLRDAALPAEEAATAAGEGRTQDWQRINTIAWEHERRLAHASLPFLLCWVGIFAAYWAGRSPRRELTLAMLWAMGLFIFMSLYLAGENSFELIVSRAGGPVFFAAWFIVFVPAALFGTLGWVTFMDLWGAKEPRD